MSEPKSPPYWRDRCQAAEAERDEANARVEFWSGALADLEAQRDRLIEAGEELAEFWPKHGPTLKAWRAAVADARKEET